MYPLDNVSDTGSLWRNIQIPVDTAILAISRLKPIIRLLEVTAVHLFNISLVQHPHETGKYSQSLYERSMDSDARSSTRDACSL